MRSPRLKKGNQTRVSRSKTYVAPVGGWNTRDPDFLLPETDSPTMVNWYPRPSYLEKRGGTVAHATGMTGTVQTLATYSYLTGTEVMFGCTASGIYDVTSSGAVGAAVLARTVAKHQWTMFGDGTNNWLCMFNGTDKPAFYNGTTWTAVDGVSVPAITGVTTTNLISGMSYQGRLFLLEANTLKFWYLPAGVVGGAAVAFDLTAQASKGGYLSEALPFTYDGGSGLDDCAIFLTSMGEAIVYKGTDPATAANWVKLGTYYVGKPASRKSMCKVGGDVFILTESGVVRMSSAMNGITTSDQFYVSDKIRSTLSASVSAALGSNFEIFPYLKENALIINQPNAQQFVMNISTGAWCLFDWSAECFGVLYSQLYFGKSTYTRKAWFGTSDADSFGNTINAYVRTANFTLGSQNIKKFKFGSINYQAQATITIQGIGYLDGIVQNESITQDMATFSSGQSNKIFTLSFGTGTYFGIYVNDGTATSTSKFYSIRFVFEDGGLI